MTNKNNKPKIPLNRKPIHEIDAEEKKKRSSSESVNEDSNNPFGDTINKESISPESNTFFGVEDKATENPFENLEDNSESNPFISSNIDNSSVTPERPESEVKPKSPDMDLVIDPEMPYFFVFGNSTAGKSAMLAGLLYYIQISRIGQLRSLSLNEHEHHRKGDYILSEMTKKVRKGEFIEGTQTLDPTEFVFPTEINLEFQPTGRKNMPFCLLEMAGEDLKEIELRDQGRRGGEFDERINAYLKHPDCQMIFICVVDVDTPANSEDLINQFLRYIHKIGHSTNPVLITINKWDKIAGEYNSAKEYLEKELPILTNNLFDDNREMAYMKFSVGTVFSKDGKDAYNYEQEDSEKLLKWMYLTATGESLDQEVKKSKGQKLFKSFKKLFSNE
jgi:GTP-binding protein EngB required for normal cell division